MKSMSSTKLMYRKSLRWRTALFRSSLRGIGRLWRRCKWQKLSCLIRRWEIAQLRISRKSWPTLTTKPCLEKVVTSKTSWKRAISGERSILWRLISPKWITPCHRSKPLKKRRSESGLLPMAQLPSNKSWTRKETNSWLRKCDRAR